MTGYADPTNQALIERSGARGILAKPPVRQQLGAAITLHRDLWSCPADDLATALYR